MKSHAAAIAAKLTAAAALLCAPAAALAADVGDEAREQFQLPTRTYSAAKTEAILGGGSALAALLGKQGVQVRQAAAPMPGSNVTGSTAAHYTNAAVDHGAHPSRPDVFGSVALEVNRTPFDARWHRVENRALYGAAGRFARSLRGSGDSRTLDLVNAYVNDRVTFTEDRDQFGTADRWLAAAETFGSGRGDCEDFAIAKMQMLRAAGFAESDLYLVVLKDLVRRADHAVLVVRSEGRFRVLDNGTDRILDSADLRDYRPVLTYSAGRSWTHGYQRRENTFPPITLAAYQPLEQGHRVALADAMAPVPASSR